MTIRKFFFTIALPATAVTLLLGSCADQDVPSYSVAEPDSIANLDYLADYDALKSYVSGDFKLGAGADATSFEDHDILYRITCANFNEITPGNEMKFSSVVDDDGTMDYNTIVDFISEAQEAGLTVYGHTLAWHSQQNTTYLNSCLEDKEVIDGDLSEVDVEDYYYSYADVTAFPWYDMGGIDFTFDGTSMTATMNGSDWQQFFVYDGATMYEDYDYTVNAYIKSDISGSFGVVMGDWSSSGSGTMNVSTEWMERSAEMEGVPSTSGFVIFQPGVWAGNISIQWIQVTHKETVGYSLVEQTDEEKKDTLTKVMDKWIEGMMEACEGYVTAWDVVNEPISGTDLDGDGYYDLWSLTRGTVSEEDAEGNFYWQDYLGDLDYVRTAVSSARTHFATYGGNSSDLKLFVNDYNLESDWDDNLKVKSLIHWIDEWESDGETEIDGIGTQMHVSYYADDDTQASKEEHITEMFELLAETGKLIRISELDMGYVDEDGNTVETDDLTDDMQAEMADFYTFIIGEYLSIIPTDQQYGITQWCITDASSSASWRASEPVGLWTEDYDRKRAYGGFADGLLGK